MSVLSDSALQFLAALTRVGVARELIERVLHEGIRSSAALGTTLLRTGVATPAQIQAAQAQWARETQPAPHAGPRLGPYLIERKLGAGAGGEVYLVRDPYTGAPYAAKRLIDLGDVNDRLRFSNEAQTLASLKHPHIARVHAADLTGPTPYFVLDYYAGGTLQTRLERGPLSSGEARVLIDKLASALEATHAQGVLHRDLKPENVLFDEAGEPRLADFGLGLNLTGHANRLTQTGVILGTPSYMPPEQALDSKRAEVRSDVYGLGAILYACLTARPPHLAQATLFGTLDAVINDPIRPPSEFATVDPQLEATCMRALSRDPQDRFASAHAFREALRAPASPVAQRRSARWPAAAALLLAAGGALGGWAALGGSASPAPDTTPKPARSEAPAPSVDPEAAIAQALDEGELQLAWELLGQSPAETPESVVLSLRLISRITDEGAPQAPATLGADELAAWKALFALDKASERLVQTALGKVSMRPDPEWHSRLAESAKRATAAITRVQVLDRRLETADSLLVLTADRYYRTYRVSRRMTQIPFVLPEVLGTEGFRQARIAFPFVQAMIHSQRKDLPADQLRTLHGRLRELGLQLDAGVGTWPSLLAGTALSQASSSKPHYVEWVEQWLDQLQPVEPKNQLAVVALELADKCLRLDKATDPPALDLPVRLVKAADDCSKDMTLNPRQHMLASLIHMTQGDNARTQERMKSVPTREEKTRLLLASYELYQARQRPPEERAPHLAEARRVLRKSNPSRARWAILRHADCLEADTAALPPTAKEIESWRRHDASPDRRIVPTWYRHYDPSTFRFPCEPTFEGDTRAELWLPEVR